MAGNKALEKFKDSKIPKKGTSTTTAEVPIYQEPNTHSKIIGTIQKDEMVNWISKSICEEKEWIRCDKKNNYGYIISGELDGTCNINMNLIQEKKEEKIENKNLDNESQLNKEESQYVQEALNEILEEDDKKDEYNSESDFSNSTGFGIDSNNFDGFDTEEKQNNTIFEVKNDEIFNENEAAFEPKDDDVFNEENLHNLYFDADISNLDRVKKEYNKLSKDFESMIEHDKDKKLNISQAIESISDILPEHNKLFEKKDLLPNDPDSKREEMLRNYLKEVKDKYDLFENINTSIDNTANKMKEMNGSFSITAGAYNGDNLSLKYYPNGWKGGSKARIKTYSAAEFGEKIGNITGKIGNVTIILDTISNGRELYNAFQEDGYKVGENTITKGGEIGGKIGGGEFGAWAGAKIGAKWGAKIGSFIPVNPLVTKLFGFVAGGVIGGIVGGILGSLAGEKGGEFIVDMKNRREEDKKE